MIKYKTINGYTTPFSECNKCGGYKWGTPMNSGHLPCDCPLDKEDIMQVIVNGQVYYYSKEIEQVVLRYRNRYKYDRV